MGMSLLPVMLQPPEGLERRQAGDGFADVRQRAPVIVSFRQLRT